MIRVQSFTYSPFQENTYLLIAPNNDAYLIDPGMYGQSEINHLRQYIESNNIRLVAVLLTHTHLDHIFGLKGILEHYDIPFFMHKKEDEIYRNAPLAAKVYGLELDLPEKECSYLNEEQVFKLGEDSITIRSTPGHSPGSVSFLSKENNFIIGGDVLFQNSIGRSDLPGGDLDVLLKSIRTEFLTLDDAIKVYSGHGPMTTIGLEKQNNPYIK